MTKQILMAVSAMVLVLTTGGCFGKLDSEQRDFTATLVSADPCDMEVLRGTQSYGGRVSAREAPSRMAALTEAHNSAPKGTVAFSEAVFTVTKRRRFFIIPYRTQTLFNVEATPLVNSGATLP